MRVGIRDAERLKDSPSSAPVCVLGRLPPTGGKALGCSNREEFAPLWDVWIHILGIGAECACWGGRAARCAAPTAETWQARAARRVVAPYKRGVWSLPPHPPSPGAPSPQGEGFWGKHPSAVWLDRQSFTPLTRETATYGRVRIPAPTAEFFGGNGGRTMCAPTGEGAGTCPLIRPSVRTGAPFPIPSVPSGHHPYPFWPSAISP